jgi:DNA mismatch repair protein MutS
MSKLTPLLDQYHRIKREYSETILLFRMGDFYETFYEDAEIASEVLGIALTSRPHGKNARVPLAGVPYRSVEPYMAKLVRAGYKVAVCEQTEDPKQAKGLVRREVTEVITPGTVVRPSLLDEKKNNNLVSVARVENEFGVAVCDLSTGEFSVTKTGAEDLLEELKRLSPSELLLDESEDGAFYEKICSVTTMQDYFFSLGHAREKVLSHFGVSNLNGLGLAGMPACTCAAGAALSYLEQTQKKTLPHIRALRVYSIKDFMFLDSATIRNLEIVEGTQGTGEGTLLRVLDATKTAMGARLLRKALVSPLLDAGEIVRRQDGVDLFLSRSVLRLELRKLLAKIGDLERLNGRVSCERASPRDLATLADSLELVPEMKRALSEARSPLIDEARDDLVDVSGMTEELRRALAPDPPLSTRDGGIVKEGYSEELDELRGIASGGKDWIARLQTRERERTGITSLKVGYNSVFGYYIEVTRPNLSNVPEDYTRKQTLANAERFVTPELKEYESKILGAEERSKSMEYDIFVALRKRVAERAPEITSIARALATLDMLASLSEVAALGGYTRPEVGEWDEIEIVEGRHPVVERLVPGFVPNDVQLSREDSQILIVTGPNMAGKSTFIRQLALLVLMAQVGSFVPAKKARVGIVDRIFTRVGASDDLSRGVSTFLAEMSETALILNSATERSLVILDEIGRGTSTFDGLSIAWAVVEYIHENPKVRAKTLFATHYHELTELEKVLGRVKNLNVAVLERGDEVVFLRKVVPGAADKSYGIYVAKLAGIPDEVVRRAREVLSNLESDEMTSGNLPRIGRGRMAPKGEREQQLTFFSTERHPVLRELEQLNVNELSPLEALKILDQLKKKYA